jgi:hypothetical protein
MFSAILSLVIPIYGVHADNQTGFRRDGSEWFSIENIELDVPENIPEDELTVRVSTSSRQIKFKHSGEKPLYLPVVDGKDSIHTQDINYDLDNEEYSNGNKIRGLTREEYENNKEIPDVLQYPWVPEFKIANDKSYVLQKIIPGKNKFVLRENDQWIKMKLLEFFTGEFRSVMKFGDNRPSSVEAPETKDFQSKRVVYDNQVYRISAAMEFQLNENYDPNAQAAYGDLDAGNMPVDTQPSWIKLLDSIFGTIENTWERLF